jgi:XTP/dITP diphosphohydrolase
MTEVGTRSELESDAPFSRIWVCSSNAGKLRDFSLAAQAGGHPKIAIASLPGLEQIRPPDEDGATFEQNAALKALYYSNLTREPVLADDSGLEVLALGDAPGVRSARYAGPSATDTENNELLLRNLQDVERREARFVCCLAVAQQAKVLLTAKGSVDGTILREARGEGGFGYDPLFYYAPFQRSFGELSPDEKLSVSHRGAALRQLFERIPDRRVSGR